MEYVTMVCAWWGCCGAQSQTCPCPLSHPCGHRAGWAPGKVAPIGRLACSVSPGFWPLEVSPNQVSALGTQSLVKHGPRAGQGRPRQADDLGLHAESAAWRGVEGKCLRLWLEVTCLAGGGKGAAGLRIDSDALRGLPPASRGLPHPWALPPASPPDPSVPLLQTSFPKEDISYAALTLDTPNQELIYSNMDGLTNHLYHQSHEEATEYSTIMKP